MPTGRHDPWLCVHPTDQAWFFTPEWLAGEREAERRSPPAEGRSHESAEDMFAHLDTLGVADA